jgi:hypothetical protein
MAIQHQMLQKNLSMTYNKEIMEGRYARNRILDNQLFYQSRLITNSTKISYNKIMETLFFGEIVDYFSATKECKNDIQ